MKIACICDNINSIGFEMVGIKDIYNIEDYKENLLDLLKNISNKYDIILLSNESLNYIKDKDYIDFIMNSEKPLFIVFDKDIGYLKDMAKKYLGINIDKI